MLSYIFFVRPLLEHGVYEKVPYEKYMLTYIFFVRPLLEHGVYEKVPYENICLRMTYIYFRKAPSRTWRVREGALQKIYAYVYIFRKAPSRTWRVREGALRARMCALFTSCYFQCLALS